MKKRILIAILIFFISTISLKALKIYYPEFHVSEGTRDLITIIIMALFIMVLGYENIKLRAKLEEKK